MHLYVFDVSVMESHLKSASDRRRISKCLRYETVFESGCKRQCMEEADIDTNEEAAVGFWKDVIEML